MAKTTFTFNDGKSITIVALDGEQTSLVSRVGEEIEFGNGRIHPADQYDILEKAKTLGASFARQVCDVVYKTRDSRALDAVSA